MVMWGVGEDDTKGRARLPSTIIVGGGLMHHALWLMMDTHFLMVFV